MEGDSLSLDYDTYILWWGVSVFGFSWQTLLLSQGTAAEKVVWVATVATGI